MKFPAVQSRTVLVTGCSSGIGLATAQVLRERAWTVFPTARKDEDLDRLRKLGFHAVRLDLAGSADIPAAVEEVLERTGGRLGGLVNNAGFGQAGALEDLSRDALRRQFEVNVFGVHELTARLIPLFRRQGWGRIVQVSSVLGRVCQPFVGAYSASKFALEALSDALRMELRGSGVAVALIEPGPIESAFRSTARREVARIDTGQSHFQAAYREQLAQAEQSAARRDPFMKPPEAVAAKIAHALEARRPKIRYPVTALAYFGAFAARFFPTWLSDRLMAGRWSTPKNAAGE